MRPFRIGQVNLRKLELVLVRKVNLGLLFWICPVFKKKAAFFAEQSFLVKGRELEKGNSLVSGLRVRAETELGLSWRGWVRPAGSGGWGCRGAWGAACRCIA